LGGLKFFGTEPRITTTKPRPPPRKTSDLLESPPSTSRTHHGRTHDQFTSRNQALAKMNINKKLDRVKQWAGEKMGAESKTNVSEEFKALEMEMQLRYEGMFALHIPRRTV
jgi:hypothetical protein